MTLAVATSAAYGCSRRAKHIPDQLVFVYSLHPRGAILALPRHVMTVRIRILHLSDLHERGPREAESWRRRRVLGSAWEDNIKTLTEEGPIDLVCFTGDLADWGLAEEYARATEFFESLRAALGLDRDRIFVVPGNHDIARRVEEEAWRSLREALKRGADLQDLSRWLAGTLREPPLGVEADWCERVLRRQEAFQRWVADGLGRPDLSPARSPHTRLGYRAMVDLGVGRPPVQIMGLDTAWLSGGDGEAGELLVTEDQFMRLATDESGKPLPGLRIALMHHPVHDLRDGDWIERRLAEFVDVVLRGHLHQTRMKVVQDPDRRLQELAVGCLYEGHAADRWPNAIQVLTIEAGEQEIRGNCRFRVWSSDGGHWSDDNGLYGGTRDGRLRWSIAKKNTVPATKSRGTSVISRGEEKENPYYPHDIAVPPRFVGREALLRRLHEALDRQESVSLVGDYRIGKSSLLRTWEEQARAAGRVVRLVSGEEEAGRSPGAFVRAVTGLAVGDDVDEAANTLGQWAQSIAPQGLPPLLLVDEVEGIVRRFAPRFFERVRGVLGRHSLIMVVSSARDLDRVYKDIESTSPWDNLLMTERVGLLEADAAEEVIRRGDGLLGDDGAQVMRVWAGRHPYFLQLLGYRLVQARRAGETVAEAVQMFQDDTRPRLLRLWEMLEPREQQALRSYVGAGIPVKQPSLRRRGVVTEAGLPFGEVLSAWVRDQ
jgi:3',5'-cyclic AMP phosphodiesterase CpdA